MTLPVKMITPSDRRPGIMRGGIIQIMITRACDKSCFHCSQGSNLAGKPAMMTVDEFAQACDSLQGYWGVIGIFGGNPTVHPKFGEICDVFREKFPDRSQRGLWCNNLMGKGRHARVTFDPAHSNLNVHLDREAHREFCRDWPESRRYLKGLSIDSVHGSPWIALKDVEPDEEKRWAMIGNCDINKHWSALVGIVPGRGLRAYFCEIAYAQAALHADDPDWPDTGLPVYAGWWQEPIEAFEDQVRLHCHSCGIPLRRQGQLAIGGAKEEFSKTHEYIARTKVRNRPVEIVSIGGFAEREDRPSTEYLPNTTPGYQHHAIHGQHASGHHEATEATAK